MEGLELICFGIISNVGAAKSMYVNAITLAKEGKFDEARAEIEEGNNFFVDGHKSHMELIQKECSGENVNVTMLLMHAEDQLISTENFKILALEFIELYERILK